MTDYKKTNAAKTTVTRNLNEMILKVDNNVYETLFVLSRRAEQIKSEMREELHRKLEEFATHQDNLEEIFENREQIEISKFYEKLPKPHSIAMKELMDDNVYFRRPEPVEDIVADGKDKETKE
jgi:DNA-directed RNA polymerase subunit K/omega